MKIKAIVRLLVALFVLTTVSSCSFRTPGPYCLGIYGYNNPNQGVWIGANLIIVGVSAGVGLSGVGVYGTKAYVNFGRLMLPQIHISVLPVIKPLLKYKSFGISLAIVSIGI